ncbi:MAG: hypothetical protein ABFS05_13270, partial [Bacteroidota bacterium]
MFILTSVIYETRVMRHLDPESIIENFQEDFSESEKFLSTSLEILSDEKYITNDILTDELIRSLSGPLEVFFFKFRDDSLTYWSDNSVPFIPGTIHSANTEVLQLANGIYFHRDTLLGPYRLCALFLIKKNFPYQNEYLSNNFNASFDVPAESSISLYPGTYNITSRDKFLFSIEPPVLTDPGRIPGLLMLALYAFAFLSLCAAIYQLYLRFARFLRSKLLLVLAFCIDVVLLRMLMFFLKIPGNLHDSHIFSPGAFAASDWVPSMGDFLFNALTILVISYTLFITYRNIRLKKNISPFRRYFLIFSLFMHIFIFYRLFLWAVN